MFIWTTVLLIALLPAVGSIGGAFLAEIWSISKRWIGTALHAAMGVAIGLVSIEIIPRALTTTPVWLIAILFGVGAAVSVLMSRTVVWLRSRSGSSSAGKWQVYSANLADLFSDGLLTGATYAVSSGLGLLLAVSQVVANVPGAFATGANFRHRGLQRNWRVLAAAAYLLPPIIGAAAGYSLLRGLGGSVQYAVLAMIAGILLVTTVEELVPEADRLDAPRWMSTMGFVGGFVFIALLAAYLG